MPAPKWRVTAFYIICCGSYPPPPPVGNPSLSLAQCAAIEISPESQAILSSPPLLFDPPISLLPCKDIESNPSPVLLSGPAALCVLTNPFGPRMYSYLRRFQWHLSDLTPGGQLPPPASRTVWFRITRTPPYKLIPQALGLRSHHLCQIPSPSSTPHIMLA